MATKTGKIPALQEKLRPMLEEVVRRRNPNLAALVLSGDLERLTTGDWARIRVSVGTELCATGLDDQDEPNARGRQLEMLIGWIGDRILWCERHRS